MRWLALLLLPAIAVASPAQESRCNVCTSDGLCAPHLQQETTCIAAIEAVWDKARTPELQPLFDSLLACETAHAGVPSPTLLRFLQDGLDFELRKLLEPQGPPPPLKFNPDANKGDAPRWTLLVGSLGKSRHPDAERVLATTLPRLLPHVLANFDEPEPKSKGKGKKRDGKGDESDDGLEMIREAWRCMTANSIGIEIVGLLAERKTEPALRASLDYYAGVAERNRRFLPSLAAKVLKFDRRSVHESVIDSLKAYDAEAKRSSGEKNARDSWGEELCTVLAKDVEARGLPPLERLASERPGTAWRKWLGKNGSKLPPDPEMAK